MDMIKLVDNTPFTQPGSKKPITNTPPVEEWVRTVINDSTVPMLKYDQSLLINQLYLLGDARLQRYSSAGIEAAVSVIVAEAIQENISQLRQRLKYMGPNPLLSNYTKAIAMNYSPIEEAKIGHFIWQVKRKLFDLPVNNQMMLVLTGQQDGGKSHTGEFQLCSPVSDLIYRADFTILEKQFTGPLYQDNYVLFFDELSKLKAADAEKLKSKITEHYFMDRGFHSKQHRRFTQNCTFIGTSNEPLGIQMIDSTGSRRFCEVETLPTDLFVKNYPVLESIDYVALWQGIDENAPSPIISFKALLRMEQEDKLTPTDHVQDFADDWLTKQEGSFTSNQDIEQVYNEWLKIYRPQQRAHRRTWLIRKLIHLGCQSITSSGVKGLQVRFNKTKVEPSYEY